MTTEETSSSPGDRALIARIVERDSEALGLLYDRYASRVLGVATAILHDNSDAEEILQEVFFYAWTAAASFDRGRGAVLAWLLVITRSRAIDRVRTRLRNRARVAILPSDLRAPHDIESAYRDQEWEALCREALRELPAEQARVLELAYFEGLTHLEIAERTSTSLGTIKTRVRLGLMKLRERIRPYLTQGHDCA